VSLRPLINQNEPWVKIGLELWCENPDAEPRERRFKSVEDPTKTEHWTLDHDGRLLVKQYRALGARHMADDIERFIEAALSMGFVSWDDAKANIEAIRNELQTAFPAGPTFPTPPAIAAPAKPSFEDEIIVMGVPPDYACKTRADFDFKREPADEKAYATISAFFAQVARGKNDESLVLA
jgi:hypothetical protein